MREIKFRAKAINDGFYKGEWVHGYYLKSLCGGELVDVITDGAHEIPIQVDTLGQFTGLCDKAGVGIYEGDILCIDSEHPNATIVWDKNNYGFSLLWFDDCPESSVCVAYLSCYRECKMKVVGNIYDTPDLLH